MWGEGDGEKRSGGDEGCRGVKYNGGEKADTTLPGFDFLISTSCDIPWGHFHNENNSHSNINFSVKKYFVNQQFCNVAHILILIFVCLILLFVLLINGKNS